MAGQKDDTTERGQIFKQPVPKPELFQPKVYTPEEQMLITKTKEAFGKVYDMFLDKKPPMKRDTFINDCYEEFAKLNTSGKFTEKQVALFREVSVSQLGFVLSISLNKKEDIGDAARTEWGIKKADNEGVGFIASGRSKLNDTPKKVYTNKDLKEESVEFMLNYMKEIVMHKEQNRERLSKAKINIDYLERELKTNMSKETIRQRYDAVRTVM
ncbi:MAG: hypothetical protein WC488_05135 [Candidatus Micrarchaeia archaeon]